MFAKESLNIGVVCGEHSGDRLGYGLINEIKKNVNVNLYGVGGPKLESLGFESEFNFSELNIMGLIEPIKNFKKLSKFRRSLIKLFINKDIDFFIGIDSPDFNMGIHKALKKAHSCKNIQVVSPSVWGWRQNRIKSILRNIDLTLCLFDFEDNYYKKVGHNSMHLGHPFSNLYKKDFGEVLKKYDLDNTKHYISVLPGSRKSEVKNMLPIYIDFIKDHLVNNPNYFYLIPVADKALMPIVNELFRGLNLPVMIKENAMRDFLSISDLSIATSGTATLESCILECPPIICYKTNFINYSIISRMLKIKDIGLPNLLFGKRYYYELLQKDCNKDNILKAALETTKLDEFNSRNANDLRALLKGKGYSGASRLLSSL